MQRIGVFVCWCGSNIAATVDVERAYAFLTGLRTRSFVGTESRLQTVVDLLREIGLAYE